MPAYPWDTRPDDHPLTADEVCVALSEAKGSVTKAAHALRVGSLTLRKFIERSPRARAVILETDRRSIDLARSRLQEALECDDHRRQDWAIRYYLNSALARPYQLSSTDDAASHALDRPALNVIVQPVLWQDGTKIGPPASSPKQIELHPNAVDGAAASSKTNRDDKSSD